MKYYIGIDGGATSSKCVVADSNLNIYCSAVGGPTNFLIRGTDEVCANVFELIKICLSSTSINETDIAALSIGSTGAGRINDAERLHSALKVFLNSKNIFIDKILVHGDVRIALEGAFSGQSGILLIAGTGSIILAKDVNGNIHRAGGFGRFIGDEGSGFSIGKKGLQAVSKYWDGRSPKTMLAELLTAKKEIGDSVKLIDSVYNKNFDIPCVAPLVIEAAKEGDFICRQILEDESEELILHVKSIIEKTGDEKSRFCLIGSLIISENYYSSLFKDKLKNMFPNLTLMKPDYPPEVGAVILALNHINE